MRASQCFMSTLKEIPHDAEIVSHQLMLRAGLIRKLGSGLYTWLPLGLKVIRRIEAIVRDEMSKIGALELAMPCIQPAELWQETGRWETFGGQLLTMQDSQQRDYCFGPTHEEIITDLMRHELRSYKQLPLNLYQIQTKFRDEIRPRFGVMRAREFLMKDAYSFHLDSACLEKTYQTMMNAYTAILTRMGLRFRAVEADTGAIGGAVSHEFQVLADAGEDEIFYSDTSAYAANREQATSLRETLAHYDANAMQSPMTQVHTPGQKSIDDVALFLSTHTTQCVKTLIVEGREHPCVALVLRGNDRLNEIKALKHPLIKTPLRFVDSATILTHFKAEPGSLGPINIDIPVVVDYAAAAITDFVCGANQTDYHYTHVVWGRDVMLQDTFDLRSVNIGDPSPDGQGQLRSCRGIEVGHVFQLGSKYAKAMGAEVIDEQGQTQTLLMGCYGLGISRLVAATIEQHHDDKGIIWPASIAPFFLCIVPIQSRASDAVQTVATSLHDDCVVQGMDVLLDDRNERPGVMFSDHDLIGIPHRIVVSEKLLARNMVEYKSRASHEPQCIELSQINDFISQLHSQHI